MTIDELRKSATSRYEVSWRFRLGLIAVVTTSNLLLLWIASKVFPDPPPWWIGPLAVLWILALALATTWLVTRAPDRDWL